MFFSSAAPMISILEGEVERSDTVLYTGMKSITIRCNQTMTKFDEFAMYKDGVELSNAYKQTKDSKGKVDGYEIIVSDS